jgi:hypothetical protein
LAKLVPNIHWTGVEHPLRPHFHKAAFQQAVREEKCALLGADFVPEPLPFADSHFSVITFSETLEHLPVERLLRPMADTWYMVFRKNAAG